MLIGLALKQTWRHPVRSGLTVLGVATGMFLYTAVETAQQSVQDATATRADDAVLIVYRENRFCPFTSRLPEHYLSRLEKVPGVAEAVPVKVVVNNCGTSFDVVTFRGVPTEEITGFIGQRLQVLSGSIADWSRRSDAALVGEILARRRGLSVGQSFDAAGVRVQVAGIVAATEPQDRDVAWVHLPFLQRAARGGLGIVTQFNVRVSDPQRLEPTAAAIDAEFRHDPDPTHTWPERAFLAQTARDLLQLIGFTRWVGLGAVLAVLALVANTMLLAVRSRQREQAILQTLGFRGRHLAGLVLIEAMTLGLAGAVLGVGGAWATLHWGGVSLANEGLSLIFTPGARVLLIGLGLGLALGLIAGLVPAWRAARVPIVASLR